MEPATFHAGEQALQVRAGVAQRLAEVGPRLIRTWMPQQHRDFFAQLPFLLAGLPDGSGQPWVGVLAGEPGFAHSPHERLLRIDARPAPWDPTRELVAVGAPVGLLGLEAHTRRRNRMNGTIAAVDATGFAVTVDQSFGNCPKYIVPRRAHHAQVAAAPAGVEHMGRLDAPAAALVAAADTFFIASSHAGRGADLSHRGGPPGFVDVQGGRLEVPDFPGNHFFNTLGNLLLQPRCGLLFVDFAAGDALWLAARAEIVGHGRRLRLHVEQALRARGALPLRWDPVLAA
ncbi:MAG TPA: pyridoxamine 5'-phosphate oxidase family protein [Ramlibacter sp.]|nr:pyridoxamine 5'-phosphate oxidase family protein [Ramlibacter sp.]